MSGNLQKKTSNILVTVLIGLIVVSFMFTGYESMRGTPDTVAKVGGIPIKVMEYQREYQRQIEFYRNIFGGKDLTTEQIENFGIKKNTIRNLIQKKLTLKLADDIGVSPAPLEIKDEIKKLPYFLTNGQFDINKYKSLLRANRLNPREFEEDMSNQVKGQLIAGIINTYPVSDGYTKAIGEFKKEKMKVHLAQINRDTLRKVIPVSKSDIKKFLAEDVNAQRVANLFKERKTALNQKEEVKARHILIKTNEKNEKEARLKIEKIHKQVTTKNFQRLAKKYTEDPSGKKNGGDLGWFGRGRMVPAFEKTAFSLGKGKISKPIKSAFGYHIIYVENKKMAKEAALADHKNELATELIRKGKSAELDKLMEKASTELKDALVKNQLKKAERIAKSYKVTLQKDSLINKFDGTQSGVFVQTKDINTLFATHTAQIFKTAPSNIVAVPSLSKLTDKERMFEPEKERKGIETVLSRKLGQDLLKSLESETKIKVFNTLR